LVRLRSFVSPYPSHLTHLSAVSRCSPNMADMSACRWQVRCSLVQLALAGSVRSQLLLLMKPARWPFHESDLSLYVCAGGLEEYAYLHGRCAQDSTAQLLAPRAGQDRMLGIILVPASLSSGKLCRLRQAGSSQVHLPCVLYTSSHTLLRA
jgi:hypothetical protein